MRDIAWEVGTSSLALLNYYRSKKPFLKLRTSTWQYGFKKSSILLKFSNWFILLIDGILMNATICVLVWCLFFNGISISICYLMLKGISPKVNAVMQLVFEHVYNDVAVRHISHYTTRILLTTPGHGGPGSNDNERVSQRILDLQNWILFSTVYRTHFSPNSFKQGGIVFHIFPVVTR